MNTDPHVCTGCTAESEPHPILDGCDRYDRIEAYRDERCECGECDPVEFHDADGVPLCAECWASLPPPPEGKGEKP